MKRDKFCVAIWQMRARARAPNMSLGDARGREGAAITLGDCLE